MRYFIYRYWRLLLVVAGLAVILVVIPRLEVSRSVAEIIFFTEHPFNLSDQAVTESSVQKLLSEVAALSAVKVENEALRAQLNFRQSHTYTTVPAYVISRDPLNENLMTVTVGAADGVAQGQAVIIGDGILIGKVLEVEPQRAVVELL